MPNSWKDFEIQQRRPCEFPGQPLVHWIVWVTSGKKAVVGEVPEHWFRNYYFVVCGWSGSGPVGLVFTNTL